jgi:COP9 signalosome complex subunit 2
MLDFVEKNAEGEQGNLRLGKFYSLTLESFQSSNNERLWLKTNIKLARLFLSQGDFTLLDTKLRELHKACHREDGSDDPAKGTLSLEVYALDIQMHTETRNNKRLKVRRLVGYLQTYV